MRWEGDRWIARLEHVEIADVEASPLNRAMGAFARQEVYGPMRETVTEASAQLGEAPAAGAGLFEPLDPASHLYDYFRVLAVLGAGPDDGQSRADALDWSTIGESHWTAPVVIELLFPDRARGGVLVEGEHVTVDLGYGVAQHEARRAEADFRVGALALIDLSDLRRLGMPDPGSDLRSRSPRTLRLVMPWFARAALVEVVIGVLLAFVRLALQDRRQRRNDPAQ